MTAKVKRYIERHFFGGDWSDAGAGWAVMDGEVRLTGWDLERRVVILRRPLQGEVLLVGQVDDGQQVLAFIEEDEAVKGCEYAVLVTSLPHGIRTVAQLYRDRGEAENTFDELKNQWGWGDHPEARLEPVTSRPLLLTGIAEKTRHARQDRLTITPIRDKGGKAKALLTEVSALLHEWSRNAEQLKVKTVWESLCDYLIKALTGFNWLVAGLEPPVKGVKTVPS